MPFGQVLDAARGLLAWLIDIAGLEGVVSVSLLVTIAALFYWGYRVSWLLSFGKAVLSGAVRHGLVSAVVLVAVVAGGLHLGVFPSVNFDPLLRALSEVAG